MEIWIKEINMFMKASGVARMEFYGVTGALRLRYGGVTGVLR